MTLMEMYQNLSLLLKEYGSMDSASPEIEQIAQEVEVRKNPLLSAICILAYKFFVKLGFGSLDIVVLKKVQLIVVRLRLISCLVRFIDRAS